MKNIIIIFIVLLMLGSCTTEKRCTRLYPQPVITKDCVIYKDVVKEIVIHDTIFIIADTIRESDTVFVENGMANSAPIFAFSDYANAKAQVLNSRLTLNLFQNDTAIARLLRTNVIVQEKEVIKEITHINKIWEVHWYDYVGRVFASLFALYCIIRIVKLFIKPL